MSRRSHEEMGVMEARVSDLIDALRVSGDPVEADLAGRLWRCQQQREERRAGERDRVDRPCRSVACEYCRRWRGREWRARAAEQMREADNAHASMVTVLLERTGDFPEVRDVVRDFRVALRNLRDRRAREDARWRRVAVAGMAEMEMLSLEDMRLLPPLRREAIAALPVRTHATDFAVVVHFHLVVSHPSLPRHAVERVFMDLWPGRGRVDVRALREENHPAENAAGIIVYATKFETSVKLDGNVEVMIPVAWQARQWGWLHGLHSGLAPLRVRMSAKRDPVVEHVADQDDDLVEVEPMPFAVSSWW